MPTIRDERLKLWSQVGEAMAVGDGAAAKLRMDVLSANFQDKEEAMKEYGDFKDKLNDSYQKQAVGIEKGTITAENPLLKHQDRHDKYGDLEWWRTRELYFFLYRLMTKHRMFPSWEPILVGETGKPTEKREDDDIGG